MDDETFDEIYKNPHFLHGLDLGKSLGHYEAVSEALKAKETGELDLWLEHQRPKTSEEWEAWEQKYSGTKFSWQN